MLGAKIVYAQARAETLYYIDIALEGIRCCTIIDFVILVNICIIPKRVWTLALRL